MTVELCCRWDENWSALSSQNMLRPLPVAQVRGCTLTKTAAPAAARSVAAATVTTALTAGTTGVKAAAEGDGETQDRQRRRGWWWAPLTSRTRALCRRRSSVAGSSASAAAGVRARPLERLARAPPLRAGLRCRAPSSGSRGCAALPAAPTAVPCKAVPMLCCCQELPHPPTHWH